MIPVTEFRAYILMFFTCAPLSLRKFQESYDLTMAQMLIGSGFQLVFHFYFCSGRGQ